MSGLTVCVTGASGFIAGQTIRALLEQGYNVRGTVRGDPDSTQYNYLRDLPQAERLSLLPADLTQPDSFDAAIAGCDYVLHTASPFLLEVKNPQHELVDPAVNGTLNVLRATQRADTVKRLVLTSSVAAITDEPDSHYVFTEQDWNRKSSLTRNAYFYSKVMAERAAWDFMSRQHTGFDMVALNPCVVIGKSLGPALNASNQLFRELLTGAFPGIMALNFCMVDVEDVARAHILAMENPDAEGRYICYSDAMTMAELVELLRQQGYSASLPVRDLSAGWMSALLRVLSYTQAKGSGDFIRARLGKTMRITNAKICAELDMTFRPVKDSVMATVADLEKWGHVASR